jgi:hypothetical protein
MAKMKTDALEALLHGLQQNASGGLNGTVGSERSQLMKRYLGKKYGDEVEGRSQIVDTTIRDTIESIKPELMDIFFGGDRVVDFTARGEEDIDAAVQETDVCNYIFQQENNGFMVLYSWITDALFQKTGYIKRYWDDQKRVEIEEYDELSPEEAARILSELDETSDSVDVLGRAGGIDEETGEVTPLYIKIRKTSTEKKYRIVNVPPEELIVHPQWTRVDFVGCPFVAHKRSATVSELIAMGFDRKEVEALPEYNSQLESEEANTRHNDQGLTDAGTAVNDDSMREVLVYENYVLCDYDGDGIAEQLRVFTGGTEGGILRRNKKPAIDFVTDAPFEALCPLPIPHRHYGLSVAELVEDLQRLKTVLSRQLVDNIVGSNNPDVVVDEDSMTKSTIEDLQYNGMSRTIRIPGGVQSLSYLPIPQTAGQSLQAIEYVDNLQEKRTGVTRYNQGTDADSLNKTKGGIKMIMSASQKKILMIARIFAETGYKSLFVHMHRDLRAGPMKELSIRLNNKYVPVNPRTWRHRSDITVSVGLGTGDKDIQLARLERILAEQKEGFERGILGYEKVHHTLKKILELSGFKDTTNFLPNPEDVDKMLAEKQPPPDPTMILAEIESSKVQAKAQSDAQNAQLEQMKIMMKSQYDKMGLALRGRELETKHLDVLMRDDRERDFKAEELGVSRQKLAFDRMDAAQDSGNESV